MNEQADSPIALIEPPSGYADWLAELKTRIHTAQQRAALWPNISLWQHCLSNCKPACRALSRSSENSEVEKTHEQD